MHYNEGIIGPIPKLAATRASEYYSRYYSGMVNMYYGAFGGGAQTVLHRDGLPDAGRLWLVARLLWLGRQHHAGPAGGMAGRRRPAIAENSGQVRLMIVFNVDLTVWRRPAGGVMP